jgi:hypothetical protein
MSSKKSLRRRLVKTVIWLAAIVVAVFALQIGLLAFPKILLRNKAEAGSVIVRYAGDPDPAVQGLAEATDHRLRASGFGDPSSPKRIFFFPEPGLYSLFARLARVHPEAQGFGISFLGNSFVSRARVEALGDRTGRAPRYSIWEGDASHTMAHEAAHLILIDSIGRSAWLSLPQWKQEGLPEYMTNIGLVRSDSTASLENRIGILLDDDSWLGPRSWDRIHYEAGLMVEFLLDVRGLELRGILGDSVGRDSTYAAMLEWYEDHR